MAVQYESERRSVRILTRVVAKADSASSHGRARPPGPPTAMAQMYEKVVSVISKPPEKRTIKEIESLIPWILKKSDLMQKLKTG